MKVLKQGLVASCIALFSLVGVVSCAQTPTSESGGQYLDSTAVTTKVKAALLNTPGIDFTDISVKTYQGTVQLSGFVNSAAQVELAGQTAQRVSGVNKVENDLQVKSQ